MQVEKKKYEKVFVTIYRGLAGHGWHRTCRFVASIGLSDTRHVLRGQ